MEENKKEKVKKILSIVGECVSVAVFVAIIVGMFFVSVFAGLCTIVASGIAFMFGFCCKLFKGLKGFLNVLNENKETFAEKTINIVFDSDANVVSVTTKEREKKKAQKKKAE